jgi:hypothetical protein
MLARHGIIVGCRSDDKQFLAEVEALYDDIVDVDALRDMVLLSSLPPDERWRVEQHRRRLERDED